MAIIKKRIENLKPGKDYVVTVRSKNPDINVYSSNVEAITFTTPVDQTIPDTLNNLSLYASFQNVMFSFDNSNENDLSYYQYELYEQAEIQNPNSPPYSLISGATVYISGVAKASTFSVAVENSTVGNLKSYFGRVRSVDTSGNFGPWTSITKTDSVTPLIDSQYVVSLTADRIKAGQIGSEEISLLGAGSIIKSSTYNGSTGWIIKGDGTVSLGGTNGINYIPNVGINLGSNVTIDADVAINANEVEINGPTASEILRISESLDGGNSGMAIGTGGNNYWYTNGNFKVGNSTVNLSFASGNLSILNASLQLGSVVGNDYATITSSGDFTVVGYDGSTSSYGTSTFYGPWFNVKKNLPGQAGANAQLMWDNLVFFKASPAGSYGIFIAGGNSGGNAFIDVGSTGITTNNSISCSGWFRSSGDSGWYNQTHGGGIWMNESTTVKVYADKNFYTGGNITSGGVLSAGTSLSVGTSASIGDTISSRHSFVTQLSTTYPNGFPKPAYRADRYYYWASIDYPGYSWPYEHFFQFVNADDNSETGAITISGGGVAYTSASDLRSKENIKDLTGGVEILKKITPVEYNFKGFTKVQHGFIAQDLYEKYGHAVTVGDANENEVTKPWSVDYGKLTPILASAVKELISRVEELESRLI